MVESKILGFMPDLDNIEIQTMYHYSTFTLIGYVTVCEEVLLSEEYN